MVMDMTLMNKQPEGTVNVGRQTLYGNPIKLNTNTPCPVCETMHVLPGGTLNCFWHYLIARISGRPDMEIYGQNVAVLAQLPDAQMSASEFRGKLLELEGQQLWCPGCGMNSKTCHARMLESIIEYITSFNWTI